MVLRGASGVLRRIPYQESPKRYEYILTQKGLDLYPVIMSIVHWGDTHMVDSRGRPLYLIYNYKRGAFYPFVPGGGKQQRDNERELVFKAQLGSELPFEQELSRWFPLWGTPI